MSGALPGGFKRKAAADSVPTTHTDAKGGVLTHSASHSLEALFSLSLSLSRARTHTKGKERKSLVGPPIW